MNGSISENHQVFILQKYIWIGNIKKDKLIPLKGSEDWTV